MVSKRPSTYFGLVMLLFLMFFYEPGLKYKNISDDLNKPIDTTALSREITVICCNSKAVWNKGFDQCLLHLLMGRVRKDPQRITLIGMKRQLRQL